MNHAAEICKAMLADGKLKLFSSVCDRVGISEEMGAAVMNRLCAAGVLRRERDYVHIADQNKATRAAAGIVPVSAEALIDRAPVAKRARAVPVPVPVPTAFTIEKGIPIPAKRWGKVAAVCPWPFLQMEVGDSFAVPVPDDMKPTQVAGALRKAVNSMRCRRMPGLRVTIRTEFGDKTVRLWRDADEPASAKTAARSSNGIRLPIGKRPGATARA